MPIDLSIVTPERTLAELPVDIVVAPGAEGEFGVLPEHETFLAPLQAGELRYEVGGQVHRLVVSGGFVEVTQERVTVLARTAERIEEIDRERAEAARDRAQEALRATDASTPREQTVALEAAAARAAARLRALER